MRKRSLAVMLMVTCLLLGGCGSGGGSASKVADESYDESYDYEEDASSDTEDVGMEEEYADSKDTEEAEEPVNDVPAEAKGIIAMIQHANTYTSAETVIQVISIDPDSGKQSMVNEFCFSFTEFNLPRSQIVYGNNKNWFSDDFTKLAVTKCVGADEYHAGWIDSNGTFFDVTKAVGAIKEKDFANPKPVQHQVVGFKDNLFAFREGDQLSYVPINNLVADSIWEADESDGYYRELSAQASLLPYPTDWIDDSNYIADIYSSVNRKNDTISSIIVNAKNDEQTTYLPESERHNWSGILNSDQSTVAFLSLPKNSVEATVELYIVPISGGNPSSIPLTLNGSMQLDMSKLTYMDLFDANGQYHCYLLAWK